MKDVPITHKSIPNLPPPTGFPARSGLSSSFLLSVEYFNRFS